jgi:FMN phosphatase YigB (HAD superfamily)
MLRRKKRGCGLSYLNLHHIFDHIVTFEDTGKRKPDPAPFEKILSLLQVAAERSIDDRRLG